MVADEQTPLLEQQIAANGTLDSDELRESSRRYQLYQFLEAKTAAGRIYEAFIIVLILVNVAAFTLASLFLEDYNPERWASRETGICRNTCDTLFFGNYSDNGLGFLGIGSTSVLEIFTIAVFTVEYILRLCVVDMESPKFQGVVGRLRYIPTFFSLVDLASTLPFYIDAFLPETDVATSSFLRMFRLLRMMKVEGRYDSALTMVDDVWNLQKDILGTALFVGVTTWLTVSSLYYLVERRNLDMIYCPTCDAVDTSLCMIDTWGRVDCPDAACNTNDPYPCYNLYESIPMASYFALLNLFGEFPLIDQHSVAGKVVGTFTAVIAVAVFALPAGIIGNGFETVIADRRAAEMENRVPIVEESGLTANFYATDGTATGRLYNFMHARTTWLAKATDHFINVLVLATTLSFMVETLTGLPKSLQLTLDIFELIAVVVFTVEYVLRVYSVCEDPKYNRPGGRIMFMYNFLSIVDLLSFAPYWIEVFMTGQILVKSNVVQSLRLLRIFRFERYTHAFLSFDDVVSRNLDVLTVTAFSAFLLWIFFGAFLYYTERDNPDDEMSSNYNTVPNALWVTLLNLSGESPLANYSPAGKFATGILGLFATAIFGIPIGILGAGFEEVIEEETQDDTHELEAAAEFQDSELGSEIERKAYSFVNGIGSETAKWFEIIIYVLIFVSVGVGVLQTVQGHEDSFGWLEWVATIVFSIEYLIRLVGIGADPEFAKINSPVMNRLCFIVSFYSIIDLLAIVPFYVAIALPSSSANDYDEYLRMLRILRLIKLDKYVPSITLIDDVVRLKFNALRVAFYAAVTLWVLFAAALYLFEHDDSENEIDPVPAYGCNANCTMMDRYQNFFDSMVYTGIHLTGDYPIITYSWPSRFTNFFMVIAAVGVVSIPSALIASGFVEIVQSRTKLQRGDTSGFHAGDDWYEIRYRELESTTPPPSRFGPIADRWQYAINEFLNGRTGPNGHTIWTTAGYTGRVVIFSVIIANILAVLLESVPSIDEAVGNQAGNFFDVFEAFSVMIFACEYALRLFCARKNREALYSPFIYATTFFGIVDFLSTAPWFVEQALIALSIVNESDDNAKIFRIFRIFRILQLEDFVTAFSKIDNVFRASKDVLKATALMGVIVWVGSAAFFYIFEENNPNWRTCEAGIPQRSEDPKNNPGCFDFPSTAACNQFYPGLCSQKAFTNMPTTLFYTAVFLGGEWGVVDFTWPGRFVCLLLCIVGIALYAIPIGTLFDSFGAVLGLAEADEEEGNGEEED